MLIKTLTATANAIKKLTGNGEQGHVISHRITKKQHANKTLSVIFGAVHEAYNYGFAINLSLGLENVSAAVMTNRVCPISEFPSPYDHYKLL